MNPVIPDGNISLHSFQCHFQQHPREDRLLPGGGRRWVSDTHRLGCVLCLVLETLDSTGSAISLVVMCMGLENGTLTL